MKIIIIIVIMTS